MLHTGLVSVTFRALKPQEIVLLTKKAGLEGIEWGGDIHVPHGNLKQAKEVYTMTHDAGLEVASYGSYYKIGCEDVSGNSNGTAFEYVLETAAELHAPTIRVWAGNKGSNVVDEEWFSHIVKESQRVSSLAEKAGITVSFEYHGNTLTDTSASACRLLREINHPNIRCYWQPPIFLNIDERLQGLKEILPWLSNIHSFYWLDYESMPLDNGRAEWSDYISLIKNYSTNIVQEKRFCMLEFVKNDSPEQFLEDAAVLKELLL